MLCIYCLKNEADAREHFLPQCLGGFTKFEPLLDRLCQKCNEEIGRAAELEFARQSPEAVLRSISWVKRGGKKKSPRAGIYQPRYSGGRHLSLYAPDPESGVEILWQLGDRPKSIKEISQLVILNAGGIVTKRISIPLAITSGQDLLDLFQMHAVTPPIPILWIIASSGDESRIERMFSDLGIPCRLQIQRKGGLISGLKRFKGQVEVGYFRALAKIGFHYALKYLPTIIGSESGFRPLREFIRYGNGDPGQFLLQCDSARNPCGPVGHLLTAVASPGVDVIVNIQFFAGSEITLPQWRLSLGCNPSQVLISPSAHFFPYTSTEEDYLTGGEVIRMNIATR
jgi:HNH endonuclease